MNSADILPGNALATDPDAASALVPRAVTPVGIIAAELEELAVDKTMEREAIMRRIARIARLAGGLDRYASACTTPESPALAALTQRTVTERWPERFDDGSTGIALEQEMLSGHVEGQFLQMLVHATGAKRLLEIGLFTGYSALAMAEALPPAGELVALELDPYVANFAKQGFIGSAGKKIRIEVGPAILSLGRLAEAGDSFDLIFIDADKGGYAAYLDLILERGLLAPRGLICVDNTLMQGEPYTGGANPNGQAIAAFNRRVADDPRVMQVLIPLRDGVTLIRHA